MAARSRNWILAVALGLAACGPQAANKPDAGASGSAEAPAASIEAALDACTDKAGLAQKICADPALAATVDKIRTDLAAAAETVSTEGDKLIVDGQRAWLESQMVACGVGADDPNTAQCLKNAFDQRLKDAKSAVEQKGGFTFQRVELNAAQPVTAEIAAAAGVGDAAPPAITRELRYPRIDNAANAAAQKFNAIMARIGQPKFKLDDATSETTDYKITFASPQLVSVQFITSDYNLGAAHPNNGMTSVTVLMDQGREITAADMFKAGSGWETFLTRRALRTLTKEFKAMGADAPDAGDVRDTATKAHNWTIAEDGLVLVFPPYSIGPFALGAQEVKVPWADLAPYVNPSAPPPINPAKPS